MPFCSLCDRFIKSAGHLRRHLTTVHKMSNECDTLGSGYSEIEIMENWLFGNWILILGEQRKTEVQDIKKEQETEKIHSLFVDGMKMDTELPILDPEIIQQQFNLLNVENRFDW